MWVSATSAVAEYSPKQTEWFIITVSSSGVSSLAQGRASEAKAVFMAWGERRVGSVLM